MDLPQKLLKYYGGKTSWYCIIYSIIVLGEEPSRYLGRSQRLSFIIKDRSKDKRKINFYRPIALLSIVSKIYEQILVNRMQSHYNERYLDNATQFGFKLKKSTEDAFLYLRQKISLSSKNYIIILFIDIKDAFDSMTRHSGAPDKI